MAGPDPGMEESPDELLPSVASWRYLEGALPDVEANLALDEALLIEADERGAGAALRIWEPEAVAVVLGASGRWREDVKVEACRRDGGAIARRSSGGGAGGVRPGALNVAGVLPRPSPPRLGA